jgi:hypothetical protein
MIAFQPFRERLVNELCKIDAGIVDLWRKSQIEKFRDDPASGLVFVGRSYYWKPLAIEPRAAQAKLLNQYRHWYEVFYRCHLQYSGDIRDDINNTNTDILSAIELKSDLGMAATFEENRALLSNEIGLFRNLLEQHVPHEREFVIVPDTNALLKSADPSHYGAVVESVAFTFVILPTVLAELDGLKRAKANPTLGEKAEKAIRFIKGFRMQGSVLDGVTVAKTIMVRMIPSEPRMDQLPSWLDPHNSDDRIIGSALEIQSAELSAVVVLVTDDMNLQNKAEMAFLPWAEPPESATSQKPPTL